MYEAEIAAWLDGYSIQYLRNTKAIIAPQELDFYFPEKKVAIEFNGLVHHSEFLGGAIWNKSRHESTPNIDLKPYHYNKWKKCDEKGIQLISIFEDEWNNRKDIIKGRILNVLELNDSRSIGARKLVLKKTTDKRMGYSFLESYHWQGGIRNFQIGYEAYFSNDLVGVITFSLRKDSIYELTRYCVDFGKYPGLFSKFLKQFTNDYNPNQIITFSDNRYATGKIYLTNNFQMVEEFREGYYITNYKDRWHKSNFRKNLLKKRFGLEIEGKTELDLIRELKFDRIWDCGKKKWIWKKQ